MNGKHDRNAPAKVNDAAQDGFETFAVIYVPRPVQGQNGELASGDSASNPEPLVTSLNFK